MGADPCADERPERRSHRGAEPHQGERHAAAMRREMIADQGRARRRHAGLADADADPEQEEHRKAGGEPAQAREEREERDRDRDDRHPALRLGQTGQRQTERRIEDRETQSTQQAELDIGEGQILLDRLAERLDHGAVDVSESRHQHDQDEQHRLIAGAETARARRVRIRHVGHQSPPACVQALNRAGIVPSSRSNRLRTPS